jgi:hypothetical protein
LSTPKSEREKVLVPSPLGFFCPAALPSPGSSATHSLSSYNLSFPFPPPSKGENIPFSSNNSASLSNNSQAAGLLPLERPSSAVSDSALETANPDSSFLFFYFVLMFFLVLKSLATPF